ncbi:hypothetical protein TSUD_22210 [Trifolium subterraneum]|uniref:Uncharacterized protein n=1 Tax=Trifolium subterraneum TaxID=3900 RepID=A0A2Z6N7B8_TRISU|nr:hypothetical protein TSUD_22210 [Trifolium subterraneum]
MVKDSRAAEMVVEEEGVKKINWSWRRLFQWEKDMVEVCSGLVLGLRRAESEGDYRKWREGTYTFKEAYHLLTEGEGGMRNERSLIFPMSYAGCNLEGGSEMARDPNSFS